VNEEVDAIAKRIDDLFGRIELEADQVDYDIAVECGDKAAELSGILEDSAVSSYRSDLFPAIEAMVGLAQGSRDCRDLLPMRDKQGDEPCPDVPGGTDYRNSQWILRFMKIFRGELFREAA
jgi:hypothetical protein